jgi:hypothetical protein
VSQTLTTENIEKIPYSESDAESNDWTDGSWTTYEETYGDDTATRNSHHVCLLNGETHSTRSATESVIGTIVTQDPTPLNIAALAPPTPTLPQGKSHVNQNRASKRKIETTMLKLELMWIRPWNTTVMKGKSDDDVGRIALYIHEVYHLRAFRRDLVLKDNEDRSIKTEKDREWLGEAIAIASEYLAKQRRDIEANVGDNFNKQFCLDTIELNKKYLDAVRAWKAKLEDTAFVEGHNDT